MYKIIYAVSRMFDWIKIAENLKNNINWEPCYWISPPELREELLKVFPDVKYHNCFDLYRGIFPEEYNNISLNLDENDIRKYLYCEHIVLKMMDRLDIGDSFTYNERIYHYFKLLNYWIKIVDEIKPDYCFFAQAPHFVGDYILYSVCKKKGIKTIITQPISSIRGLMLLNTEIEETNKQLRNRYKELLESEKIELDGDFNDYLKNLRSKEYGKAQPTYIELGLKETTVFSYLRKLLNLKKWIHYFKVLIKKVTSLHKEHKNYLKLKNKPFHESTLNNFQYKIYRRRGNLYKKNLKKYYLKLCEKPDFNKKYIYIALHYQPERSTSPEGGVFVEQELMVSLLSSLIPENYFLYIKEHPLQFSSNLHGEHGRKKDLYDNLIKLKNVKLISNSVSVFDLIDNSEAVATVKGTASLESLLRGKPALVFGNAWYRDCKGVFYAPNKHDLKNVINNIINGVKIDNKHVLAFLKAVEEVGFTGCVANKDKKILNLTDNDNIENFSNKIIKYFRDQ